MTDVANVTVRNKKIRHSKWSVYKIYAQDVVMTVSIVVSQSYFTNLFKLAFKGRPLFERNNTCNCSRATDKPPLAVDDKAVHYNAIVAFAQS